MTLTTIGENCDLRPAPTLGAVVRRWSGCGAICLWRLFAVCCFVSDVLAQYRFDSWTVEDGLPQNSVLQIRQTRDGYLWLSTENGLVRFDGMRLTVFSKGITPGITGARFRSLWESRDGDLWASTIDGGVIRHHNGVFTGYTTKEGLPNNRVSRIDEDAEGTIWFYHDNGLSQWKKGRLIRVAPEPGPHNYLTSSKNLILGEYEGMYGHWRLDATGWSRFAYGKWWSMPLPPHLTDPAKLQVKWLFEDSRRRLWFNVVDRPGEYYCVSDGRLTVFSGIPRDHRVCYQDRQGNLWMSDPDGNVKLWRDGQITILPGLRALWAFRILEDREGILWIGTYDQGLNRRRGQVITVYRHPGGADANFIYTLLQDRAGDVWVSSGFRGLTRLRNGRFEEITLEGRPQTSELSSIYEDTDGSLWVGAYTAGILRFTGGELRREQSLSSQIEGRIDAIHRDRAGVLWLGGRTGLYRWRDGRLTHYTSKDGMAGNHVKVIYEDQAGTLWIGGYGGLSQFRDGKFTSLTEPDDLLLSRVITLYEDVPGTLWIGTYDGGLHRLKSNKEGRKLTQYSTRDGLYDIGVHKILEDDQGFFWISCGRGIYRVRKEELNEFAEGKISYITSTPFGKADGLVNVECPGGFQPAGFKASDGKLWFPSQEGVAVIDPRLVPFNPTPPTVVIEDCTLDRRPVAFRHGVKIEPGQKNLEINYTGLSFIKSDQMRFRYKLEGLDQNWVEAGARRTAYYSHLPPGEYAFKVIAANSDGVWNTEGQSLQLIVLPPFYRTWWFLTLIGLGVAGIVLLIYEYRVRRLKWAQAEQQAFSRLLIASQERERKRIAAELHDSLGQSLLIIKNRAALGLEVAQDHHPATEQLDGINTVASQAINEVRSISYNLRPLHLERLGLAAVIEEMIEKVAGSSTIQFSADIPPLDGLFSKEDEINLYRIIQESVNNIIKHSQATRANVEVWIESGQVHISVSDNGRGFITEAQVGEATPRGLGLTSMTERVRMLGGEHTVNSALGQGTTISIRIPALKPKAEMRSSGS